MGAGTGTSPPPPLFLTGYLACHDPEVERPLRRTGRRAAVPENCSSQTRPATLYAAPVKATRAGGHGRDAGDHAGLNRALLRAGIAGNPALPTLSGRGTQPHRA